MNKFARVLLLAGLVISAGCFTTPQGDSISIIYHGEINSTDSHTSLDGELFLEEGNPENDRYEGISVYGVNRNGTIQSEQPIDPIDSPPGSVNVSAQLPDRPAYIVFNAADFWSEQSRVAYLEWDGDDYVRRYASSEPELPGFGGLQSGNS